MKRVSIILLFVFFIVGCGGNKIAPSADFLLTQNAIEITNSIKEAYEKKDRTLIKERVEPSISESILKSLAFDEAKLSFTVRMVRIQKTGVRINLNWTGQWLLDSKKQKNRGVATLIYKKDGEMKLIRIEGDSPFLIPGG